ncbi:MAG: SGNH/GDSL hydrolase family protein [Planctomycetota bacterium]
MRGLRRFIVSFVSCVICLVVFDVILEANPSLQVSFVSRFALWPNGNPGLLEDRTFGYLGRPDFVAEGFFDPEKDGDLVLWMRPERIEKTGEDVFPTQIELDSNGFLNAAVPEKVDMLIVGDSFSVGSYVPEGKHWVPIIRDRQKKTVYNIAMPGWGTWREYLAFEQFGLPKKPNLVLWAFFEGNDIGDVRDFEEFKKFQKERGLAYIDYIIHKRPYIPPRRFPYGRPVVRLLLHFGELCNPSPIPFDEDVKAFNPVFLSAGGGKKPHAILPGDFSQMSMPQDILSGWSCWQKTETLLMKAIDQTLRNGGRFVLILFPSKDRVYFPLIDEQVDKEKFYRFVLPSLLEGQASSPDELFRKIRRNKSNVSNLLEEICRRKSVPFIDTTDVLAEATMRGEFPYHCYDNHFNQKGNELVAKLILDRMREEGFISPEE